MTAQLLPKLERGYTYSEEWKRICLVRDVARMTNDRRKEFFQHWERFHGRESAECLDREVRAEWLNLRSA